MASYRYRCKTPAEQLNIPINAEADLYVLCKPAISDIKLQHYIADFCDDHFDWPHYQHILKHALHVTCPTDEMARIIKSHGREATVIHDPYEYPLEAPHCDGDSLLWFGHGSNLYSIEKLLPMRNLRIVSNVQGAIPWSWEGLKGEFAKADIVLMPATKGYKSPNRTIEAIRQGCFVVAEPHPSINDFPIYIGDINEGIAWAKNHPQEANQMITKAQSYIERYSPKTVGSAWKTVMESVLTLVQAKRSGKDGQALT